jgi:prepilin-type N-terminal cleavage/methylation domain-containing protein
MKNKHPIAVHGAFSLVELSIVIVILALLIGGIFTGRSLIRAAELRSVMTDANAYIAAVGNFRTQYRYLPGDAPNAESYWGAATTVNGNGDGLAEGNERFRFWQHLNLAGFVEKSFSGSAGGGGANDFIIKGATANAPDSRIQLAGFGFYYANEAGNGSIYTINLGNAFTFGRLGAANSGPPTTGALTPVDAATVDTKMDDGRPGIGKWVAATYPNCTTSANQTDYAGMYNTTVSDVTSCAFLIMSGY